MVTPIDIITITTITTYYYYHYPFVTIINLLFFMLADITTLVCPTWKRKKSAIGTQCVKSPVRPMVKTRWIDGINLITFVYVRGYICIYVCINVYTCIYIFFSFTCARVSTVHASLVYNSFSSSHERVKEYTYIYV